MKTNTENNTQTSNAPVALETVATVPNKSVGSTWLKLLVVAAALVASGVTYQTVVEAVELDQALDSCHKAMSSVGFIEPEVSIQANISETNLPVAGL